MTFQTVFKRFELKYMLTMEQKESVLAAMAPHMQPDLYGRTIIRNLYCDTDTYLLARRSIEKPVYKEKLRIRSYAQTQKDSTVFVELKKKYNGVVYKRRISMPEAQAESWITGRSPNHPHTQIAAEVESFLRYYRTLHPVVFLSYAREAYAARDGSDFRVTFDDTILCRQQALSLGAEVYGTPLLPADRVLMEIKCSGGMPLWMTRILSAERLYKTSFSKYGTAYQTMIFPQQYSICLPKKEVTAYV